MSDNSSATMPISGSLLAGSQASDLNLNVPAPAVILLAGLQGAGKTTTVGKLAKFLKEKRKKKVMVVSCDVYRPAAIQQLETLAKQSGAIFFASNANQKPEDIREWLSLTKWSQKPLEEKVLNNIQNQLADLKIIDKKGTFAEIVKAI